MGTTGEGGWEELGVGIGIYTLRIKWITNENLLSGMVAMLSPLW